MRSQHRSPAGSVRSWVPWTGAAALAVAVFALGLSAVRAGALDASIMHGEPDAVRLDPRLQQRAEKIAAPIFARRCAVCHGARGEGDVQKGAPDLTDDDWLFGQGRPNELEQTILHGIRAGDPKGHAEAVMPAYGAAATYEKIKSQPLTPAEVRRLAAYVLRLSHIEASGDDAVEGAAIFGGKGGCYDCHGRSGNGDPAIGAPKLNDGVWLTTFPDLAGVERVILEGRAGVCPAWGRKLTPLQVRSLAVYVAGLSDPQTPS